MPFVKTPKFFFHKLNSGDIIITLLLTHFLYDDVLGITDYAEKIYQA